MIVQEQPIIYLQPAQPIPAGRLWLGVTYEPYEGGGAYVTGIYDGSPAQAAGIEVGDVIAYIDGVAVDGVNLPTVVQQSDGDVVLEVLSGRTGDFLQAPVSLVVN